MKTLSLLAVVLTLGLSLSSGEAEAAKRLGLGKSSGMQREMTAPNKAPTAAPAQAPTSASAAAKSPATATPQAQPKRSWMGPLAGLAAGLGLAALASHFGFGEELASMLMIGLIVMAVMVVIGMIMRKRAAPQSAMAGAGGYRFSPAAEPAPAVQRYEAATPLTGAATSPAIGARIPADFDAEGFARNAKVQFIRLQAANDAGNLDDIREFTTPEMFAEVKLSIGERGNAPQETDVLNIDAEVLEVVEEENRYVVSVRFTGLIREEKNGPAEPVDEIWHLVKPRTGKGGWLLAGIQQMN